MGNAALLGDCATSQTTDLYFTFKKTTTGWVSEVLRKGFKTFKTYTTSIAALEIMPSIIS